MEMRTKEQIHHDIRQWEYDAGESFLDYFGSSLNEFNFMFWCLGKGYINAEQMLAFEAESYIDEEFLYGEEVYSVVNKDKYEDWEEGYEQAISILADFFSSTVTYQTRLNNFLNDVHEIKFEEALKFRHRDKIFYELNGEKVYIKNDTPLTVDIVLQARWYREE